MINNNTTSLKKYLFYNYRPFFYYRFEIVDHVPFVLIHDCVQFTCICFSFFHVVSAAVVASIIIIQK